VLLGTVAGALDVIPMMLQRLTWDANLSAFFLWIISGFMLATSTRAVIPPWLPMWRKPQSTLCASLLRQRRRWKRWSRLK
jgi:hypothetical protein